MKEDEKSVAEDGKPEESSIDSAPFPEELSLPATESIAKFFSGKGLADLIRRRAFFPGLLELPKDRTHWSVAILFILLAYLLSFYARLEWIEFAQASFVDEKGEIQYVRPNMVIDGTAVANTHDSFYFGSILQKAHLGMHRDNNLLPSPVHSGMITALPYALLKVFPSLTIEQLLLWLPVYLAGLVCIPIVLIGRLYGSTLWGFFAACLAGITHSYYNRTLAGYYDTDIFSITVPAFALYFLLGASRRESLHYALAAAVTLYLYRFFYTSGQAITGSLAVAFVVYRTGLVLLDFFGARLKGEESNLLGPSTIFTCKASLLIGWATYAEAWSYGRSIENNPEKFWMGLLVLPVAWGLLCLVRTERESSDEKSIAEETDDTGWNRRRRPRNATASPRFFLPPQVLVAITVGGLAYVILFGGVQGKIFAKLSRYVAAGEGAALATSAEKGYHLQFTDVLGTVREAGEIASDVVRNRILADTPSCSCPRCLPAAKKKEAWIFPTAFLGLFGFGLLVLWRWEFCMGIPFAAIAYYCFQGKVGLRFTVHVGNVAALGVTFVGLAVAWLLIRAALAQVPKEKFPPAAPWAGKILAMVLVGGFVVLLARPNLQHARNYNSHVVYPVKTVEALKALDRNASTDDFVVTWWDYGSGSWFYGGVRTFTSPAHQTVDNFLTSEILRSTSHLKAANLCRLKAETYVGLHDGDSKTPKKYTTVAQALFKDGSPDLVFYPGLLAEAEKPDFPLPAKTREVYLFFPFEILRIFPTIMGFSTRNLLMSKQLKQYPGGRVPKPITFLRDARREGKSVVFANGFRLDRRGSLRTKSQAGVAPYRDILVAEAPGQPARVADSIEVDGLRIASKPDRSAPQRLLYLPTERDLLILSSDLSRSTLAKRFLLDRFDADAYGHPAFATAADLRRPGYMTQADWVTSTGGKVKLNMRGGYKIEANLKTGFANLPGLKDPIKFSFHRAMHDVASGRLLKMPSKIVKGARYHLIQSNLPAFLGGRTYVVPKNGRTIRQIAAANGVKPAILASTSGRSPDDLLPEGETIEIPSRGYQVIPAWFFMDDSIFRSLLIQGFLMENLDPKLFEPVYRSPWGKVYRVLR